MVVLCGIGSKGEIIMSKFDTWKMMYPLFTPREFGKGAYEHMDDEFLLSFYRFRVAMDNPIIIHEAYATEGHAIESYHYLGRACDFHFKYNPVPIRRVLMAAIKSGLHGIGFYPYWNNVGFHLDNRPPNSFNMWVRNEKGIYTYIFPTIIPESLEEWGKQW